jgi:hypothetical protein
LLALAATGQFRREEMKIHCIRQKTRKALAQLVSSEVDFLQTIGNETEAGDERFR